MCLFNTKPPAVRALPPVPSVNDEEVKRREALARERMMAGQGTAGTVKTDLAPSQVAGQKRVLLGV